jgi:hypothetical protein
MPTSSPEVAACTYVVPASGATGPQCVAIVGVGGDYGRYAFDVAQLLTDIRLLLIFALVLGTLLGVLMAFRLTFTR